MANLRFTKAARADLNNITLYIAAQSGSRRTASFFRAQIREKCEQLARLPGTMGRLRPEIAPSVRSTAFRGYVIFYRYADDVFEVLNIFEGHRDIEGHFHGDEE